MTRRDPRIDPQEGDVLYLPPHTKHRFINYNARPIIGYFAIGGEL